MTKTTNTVDFEILIATMYRDSLEFLETMFPNHSYKSYAILIINQTSKDKLLVSSSNNIRVINSFDKGLAKSRNLAIKNAIGSICLLTDDDVCYVDNLQKIIYEGYKKYSNADIVTFKMINQEGNEYKEYLPQTIHDKKSVQKVNSVVISFKRQAILDKKIWFNELFGLGANFPTADEYIFLRDALKAHLKLYFYPKVILSHPSYSSGMAFGSDAIIYAKGAQFYKYSGWLGYLRVIKHLYGVYKNGYLKLNEIPSKIKIGYKGIKDYKKLRASKY